MSERRNESSAATGRDTWTASARPWRPCPDAEPHPRHEWFDGVKREDCRGVSAARKRPGIVEFLRAPSEAPNWVVLMLSVYTIAFALILVTR